MKYKIISNALFCFIVLKCNSIIAQSNIAINNQIDLSTQSLIDFYRIADSLNLAQPNFFISEDLISKLKENDKKLPYHFLTEATSLFVTNSDKLDQVAVLMIVGFMRYDYYKRVFPDYAPNGEGWAWTESIKQNEKLKIDLYLQNNIEKYKTILNFAINYCTNNTYTFYTKPRELLLFRMVMQPYKDLLNNLETNKDYLTKKWTAEKFQLLSSATLQNTSTQIVKHYNTENKDDRFNKYLKAKDSLWKKIDEQRNNPDSTLLKKYVLQYIEFVYMKRPVSDSTMIKSVEEIKNVMSESNSNITISNLLENKSTNLDTLKNTLNKQDVYNYYDAVKGINTWKFRIAKANLAILEYINKYKWSEEIKLKLFDLTKYTDRSFNINNNVITRSKTQMGFQNDDKRIAYVLKLSNEGKVRRNNVIAVIGDINGTIVLKDIQDITDKFLTQPIEHLK